MEISKPFENPNNFSTLDKELLWLYQESAIEEEEKEKVEERVERRKSLIKPCSKRTKFKQAEIKERKTSSHPI